MMTLQESIQHLRARICAEVLVALAQGWTPALPDTLAAAARSLTALDYAEQMVGAS